MKRSLRSWLWSVPVEDEVDQEIALHIELRTRDLMARGVGPEAARRAALEQFGDRRLIERTCVGLGRRRERTMRLARWFEELRGDVAFALRQMKATPVFAGVVVLTLALGIGANGAIFAIADAALLRPLPYPSPDSLVMLWEARPEGTRGQVNPVEVAEWSERNRTFEAMAAVVPSSADVVGVDGLAEVVPAQAVTSRFFDVLGVRPIEGRTFVPGDDRPDSWVVVLSEGFWRRRYGGDPSVVGSRIRLSGQAVTVVGVVPATFQLPLPGVDDGGAQLWRLLSTPGERGATARYAHYLRVIGRLAPGVSLEAARRDLAAVAGGIAREWPDTSEGHGVAIEPLRDGLLGGELRLTAVLLLGVVGFVLLICCANVANLLLARTTARTRELAVRAALGAGRQRIARQLLTESLVLAAIGGLIGAAIGAAALAAAPVLTPPGLLPVAVTPNFDGRVLAFCAMLAVMVAFAFGLVPAWQATGVAPTRAVVGNTRTTTGHGARFRTLLAAAQVAVAVLLVCGAGLLLRTLLVLENVDPGHEGRNVLTTIVNAGMGRDPDALRRFYAAVEQEVGGLPGVRRMAWGSGLPLDGFWYGQAFSIVGDPPKPDSSRDGAVYQIVSPSYFDVLGIPILRGRAFDDSDSAEAVQIGLVNEAFVRRFLGDRDPLGVQVDVQAMVQPSASVVREIVGVVAQVRGRPHESEPVPQIYVPLAQNPWWSAQLLVAPAEGPASALTPTVRAAVARVDSDRAITSVRTLDEVAAQATARPRFRAVLVMAFAALALALAVVGVFGVLAYAVQQRTREFGVRIALGARTADVLRLVMGGAARIAAAGTLAGLATAVVFSRWMATLLFGVEPLDVVSFAGATLVLGLAVAAASAVPAWRAARVDPVVTFREE